MTTKPTHTTVRRRHSVDARRALDKAKRDQLERELADALNSLDTPAGKAGLPKVGNGAVYLVVTLTVRHGHEGLPHRWEFTAPRGCWKSEAEHLARIAARKAGLTVHAHIDTEERTR